MLGEKKEDVIDAIFGFRIPGLAKKSLGAAYDLVDASATYGSPRSAWGMANGLTALSQQTAYTDDRMSLDRAAGRLLTVAAEAA